MRKGIWLSVYLGLLSGLSGAGCAKEVKAEFPRLPAVAVIPPPEEAPSEAPAESVEEETETVAVAEPEPEPEPEEPASVTESPPPRAEPVPADPPEEPPPEPPSTQLAGRGDVDPEIRSKFQRAGSLLSSVDQRRLSTEQRQQVTAARAFVSQARQALDDGDDRRALVLIDKGLILAEDVERASRP